MMVWSKRGNINTATLVTIAQCNTLVARCSRQLIGLADWVFVTLGPLRCDYSLSRWPTGFLQCFDAVGWVIWPVKIVSEMTYKVSSGTLNRSHPDALKWVHVNRMHFFHIFCYVSCKLGLLTSKGSDVFTVW